MLKKTAIPRLKTKHAARHHQVVVIPFIMGPVVTIARRVSQRSVDFGAIFNTHTELRRTEINVK